MKNHFWILVLLAAAACARAQQLPTAEELVPRIVAYAQQYRQRVPSLEADESAVSQQLKGGKVKWEVRLEMTERVLRDDSDPNGFVDRYTFNSVDGKTPAPHFKMPYFVQGVFSNAVGFARREQQACFEYYVSAGDRPTTATLQMWVKPGRRAPGCEDVFEDYHKTLVVDIASGTILHLTRSMSARAARENHEIVFIELDYALQKLGDESFWLPAHFTARDEKNEHRMMASYSNYHRYTGTAKIVSSEPVPEVVP